MVAVTIANKHNYMYIYNKIIYKIKFVCDCNRNHFLKIKF